MMCSSDLYVLLGCGLLYYGQNYLIYPSAFPPGSRTGVCLLGTSHSRPVAKQALTEVPVPTDFGLEYQDLPLVTEDGFTLRCYFLMQRTEISNNHAAHIDYANQQTHEEVRHTVPILYIHSLHLFVRSIQVCIHSTDNFDVPW